MKRILATMVALGAVLAFGSTSHAASITFDHVTDGGAVWSFSTLAPCPPCAFISPFASTSSSDVDLTGSTATYMTGSLHLAGTTDLGAYGTVTTDVTVDLSGGTGVLTGDVISWMTATSLSTEPGGTISCTGIVCSLIGITEGTTYDISVYNAYLISQGVSLYTVTYLGNWYLDPSHSHVLASSLAITARQGSNPAQAYQFGATVPEPGTFALVLLGLGGLALRSRKA